MTKQFKHLQLSPPSPLMDQDFIFGVATSSFQIEGNSSGRLPCIWDTFSRQPGAVVDGSNGDVACEHIKRWEEDVTILLDLGVDAYRLSLSWPRIMNESEEVNQQGMDFYLRLIDTLNAHNIKVFVTLYHWDLPQYLEDKGGWLNRDTAYAYQRYVKQVAQCLKDKVYSYATFNEPFCSSYLGYEIGVHAPGKIGRRFGRQAAHHILLAHGLGMQVLQDICPDVDRGIVLNFTPCYPASNAPEDAKATQLADEYINLWYLQPLLEGKYPDVIAQLDENDKPEIVAGDMQVIQQPLDFLGVNYYTRLTYSAADKPGELYKEHPHQEPKTAIGWEIYPQALADLFSNLSVRFELPPIYITENGAAMADEVSGGEILDLDRIAYYQQHLNVVEEAVSQGVDIRGYFAWSLMDNFEWAEGYTQRFGLIYVDFETQKRTFKASAKAYQGLLKAKKALHND